MCLLKTKEIKKIQYSDTKFRLIQAMYEIIKLKKIIEIQYYCSSYKNGFVNIIINTMVVFTRINNMITYSGVFMIYYVKKIPMIIF